MPAPDHERRTPCPNCGSPDVLHYCPACGQRAPRPADYSAAAFAGDLFEQLTSSDSRTARTLRALLLQPGALSADHLAGRRARYLRPLQLFLIINVLLFFAAPQVPLFSYSLEQYLRYAPPSPALVGTLVQRVTPHGHAHPPAVGGAEFEAYAQVFDARIEAQRKSLVILLAPSLAVVLWLLFAWRGAAPGVPRRFGEHLVFSLHVLAFVWLVLAGLGLLSLIAGSAAGASARTIVTSIVLVLLLVVPLYLLLAVRRVYRLTWIGAVLVAAAVAGAFTALLVAYRGLLFFTTYYTL